MYARVKVAAPSRRAPGLPRYAADRAWNSRTGSTLAAHRLDAISVVPRDSTPLQLKRVDAGYNAFAMCAAGDVLATSSLAGCIAVVAQAADGRAAMAHYDPIRHYPDWTVGLTNLREELKAALGVEAATYYVGLGQAYPDGQRIFEWQRNLVVTCIAVFGDCECDWGKTTMLFDTDARTIVGREEALHQWADKAGTQLDYEKLDKKRETQGIFAGLAINEKDPTG